jgi:hypothetical protein
MKTVFSLLPCAGMLGAIFLDQREIRCAPAEQFDGFGENSRDIDSVRGRLQPLRLKQHTPTRTTVTGTAIATGEAPPA